MALTQSQVRVLAVLADLRAMTTYQVRTQVRLSDSQVRAILNQHACLGLVRNSDQRPMRWRITSEGKAVLNARAYREYVPHADISNRAHR